MVTILLLTYVIKLSDNIFLLIYLYGLDGKTHSFTKFTYRDQQTSLNEMSSAYSMTADEPFGRLIQTTGLVSRANPAPLSIVY
jgi:hypothetical protein